MHTTRVNKMNITKEQATQIDKKLDECRGGNFKTSIEYDEEYKVLYITGFIQADILKELIQEYEIYHTNDNKICIFMRREQK